MVREDENEQVTFEDVTKFSITKTSDNPYNEDP